MKQTKFMLAAFTVSLAAAPAALVDGLRNYWNFDDNLSDAAHGVDGSASTVGDDAVGVQDGTVTYAAGKFGNALSTNGAGDGLGNSHVVVDGSSADVNGYAATSTLTISGWFQVAAFDTGWQAVVAKGEGNEYRVARSGDSNNLAYAGGNGDITANTVDISSGWHHFVAISNGASGTSLYVDGSANLFTNPAASVLESRATNFLIGANPQGNADTHFREFNGLIDDVAMWDRALTATEVDQIFNSPTALGSMLAVPEPSAALLGLLGLLGLMRRRR